jgi:hypothetical protein
VTDAAARTPKNGDWRRAIDAGDPWSEMALWDLKNELEHGSTIAQAAVFLCRSGTIDDVRRKADELGLKYPGASPRPPKG